MREELAHPWHILDHSWMLACDHKQNKLKIQHVYSVSPWIGPKSEQRVWKWSWFTGLVVWWNTHTVFYVVDTVNLCCNTQNIALKKNVQYKKCLWSTTQMNKLHLPRLRALCTGPLRVCVCVCVCVCAEKTTSKATCNNYTAWHKLRWASSPPADRPSRLFTQNRRDCVLRQDM